MAKNSKAVVDGTISHSYFDDWVLNLDVDTRGDRFLILNTEFKEGDLYYGTGYLEAMAVFLGLPRH